MFAQQKYTFMLVSKQERREEKQKKKKTSKRMKCVSVDFVFYLHEILARRTMAVNHLGFCYFLPIHFRQLLLSRVHTFVPGTADARRAAESRVLSHFRLDHSSSLRLCMKWRVFALNAVPYYYSKNSRAANRRIECIAWNEIAALRNPPVAVWKAPKWRRSSTIECHNRIRWLDNRKKN